MFEYDSIPSPNGHESMTRPRPLKYGLETESEMSPSLEYYNTALYAKNTFPTKHPDARPDHVTHSHSIR